MIACAVLVDDVVYMAEMTVNEELVLVEIVGCGRYYLFAVVEKGFASWVNFAFVYMLKHIFLFLLKNIVLSCRNSRFSWCGLFGY